MAGGSRGVEAETGCHGFLQTTSMWLLDLELLTGKHVGVLLLLNLPTYPIFILAHLTERSFTKSNSQIV